jgi:hypothetical protein
MLQKQPTWLQLRGWEGSGSGVELWLTICVCNCLLVLAGCCTCCSTECRCDVVQGSRSIVSVACHFLVSGVVISVLFMTPCAL